MKFILFILFVLITKISLAQTFEGGFFGGFSASQVDGDRFSGYNRLGLTAGAYITRELKRNIVFKNELRYIQKGAYKRNTEQDPTYYKTSLHYAEIPVLIQYLTRNDLYLEAGLVPEILLYSREENEDGIIPTDQTLPYHRFSLEGTAGLGYFFTKNLSAGFRYTYSILTARDHASGQTYLLNRGQYNNVLSFSLYYHIR